MPTATERKPLLVFDENERMTGNTKTRHKETIMGAAAALSDEAMARNDHASLYMYPSTIRERVYGTPEGKSSRGTASWSRRMLFQVADQRVMRLVNELVAEGRLVKFNSSDGILPGRDNYVTGNTVYVILPEHLSFMQNRQREIEAERVSQTRARDELVAAIEAQGITVERKTVYSARRDGEVPVFNYDLVKRMAQKAGWV